jgi:hypothetical protein
VVHGGGGFAVSESCHTDKVGCVGVPEAAAVFQLVCEVVDKPLGTQLDNSLPRFTTWRISSEEGGSTEPESRSIKYTDICHRAILVSANLA